MSRIDLGTFQQGTIPEPLVHTFYNSDGKIDLTNWQVIGFETYGPGGAQVTGTPTITDARGGEVTYEWQDGDMSVTGSWTGTLWVESSTQREPSGVLVWRVIPGYVEA